MPQKDNLTKTILSSRDWYRQTSKQIKDELENLPAEFIGAAKSLSEIPIQAENKVFNKVLDFKKGSNGLFVELEYISKQTNEKFIQDIYIPKSGDDQSSYGVIGLANKKKITHLVIPKKQSLFSITKELSAIGTHFPNFQQADLMYLPSKLVKELKAIVKQDVKINRFYDLGDIYTETISPHKVSLFLMVMSCSNTDDLVSENDWLKVVEIGELPKIIKQSKNSVLLSILAKVMSSDIL